MLRTNLLECSRELGEIGVFVAVGRQIDVERFVKCLFAERRFEHTKNSAACCVRDAVEMRLFLVDDSMRTGRQSFESRVTIENILAVL